ncbi:anthranilate synthase component I family protein [Campylobacter troglodytis]|uniref:anthranilate synthase component I family protein n=1 Tax=Campylobacter troglodytis TaxID=654363 RepID=UPI0031F38CA7
MLTGRVQDYYKELLARFPKSYYAEDESKVIIGIDGECLDAKDMDFSEFKARFYERAAKVSLCEYAGFFGVLAADFITLYEDIKTPTKKSYDFPLFFFLDARAYLIYHKHSKLYESFGDEAYFEFLDENSASFAKNSQECVNLNSKEDLAKTVNLSSNSKENSTNSQECVNLNSKKNSAKTLNLSLKQDTKSSENSNENSKTLTTHSKNSSPATKNSKISSTHANNTVNSKDFKITSDLNKEKQGFLAMVQRAKEYLLSGDIFQVVLSSQLCVATSVDSFEFYEELALQNPSPYMFHLPTPYGVVVGSSPELVLSIKNKELFVAPIAGTRNLSDNTDKIALQKDLLSDEKELSEHRMLVDLARNDVSKFGVNTRVANPFSVVSYQYVMHIVSEVYANLREDASIFDAINAVFPAGTLSGAPKIRALELISELEGLNRGIYGGAIGFLKFSEDVLLAILIRSLIFTENKAYIASGAGIVAHSQPKKEYEEICAKRRSLLSAFESLKDKR